MMDSDDYNYAELIAEHIVNDMQRHYQSRLDKAETYNDVFNEITSVGWLDFFDDVACVAIGNAVQTILDEREEETDYDTSNT